MFAHAASASRTDPNRAARTSPVIATAYAKASAEQARTAPAASRSFWHKMSAMDGRSLDIRAVVPEAVITRELDGEAIPLNLETGIYFGLDKVGTDVRGGAGGPAGRFPAADRRAARQGTAAAGRFAISESVSRSERHAARNPADASRSRVD